MLHISQIMKRYILCALGVLSCTILALPERAISQDLRIRSIRRPFEGEVLTAGERFRVEADEINNTNTDAGPSYTGYYLSQDETLDGSDILMGKQYRDRVTANPFGGDFEWSPLVPSNTISGIYHVLVVADVDNQINESNESNNVGIARNGPFTVQGETPPTEKPDLTVANSISVDINRGSFWEPNVSSAVEGDQIRVNYDIYNATSGSTNSSYWVAAIWSRDATPSSDDLTLWSKEMPTLSGETSAVNNIVASFTGLIDSDIGQGYIIVVADDWVGSQSDKIDETNENNNYRALSFRVNGFGSRLATTNTVKKNLERTVKNIPNDELLIYPNPVTNNVNVIFNSRLPTKATIHDLSGKLIWEKEYEGVVEESVDLNNQAPGMYLLKVTSQQGTQIKKFIKE